jgi:hypothetical protein
VVGKEWWIDEYLGIGVAAQLTYDRFDMHSEYGEPLAGPGFSVGVSSRTTDEVTPCASVSPVVAGESRRVLDQRRGVEGLEEPPVNEVERVEGGDAGRLATLYARAA